MRWSRRIHQTIERRKFLKLVGGAAGGAVALGSGGTFVRARRADAQVSLAPFVDALPIPRVISPSGRLDGDPLFRRRRARSGFRRGRRSPTESSRSFPPSRARRSCPRSGGR
ncbi:MAG: hypothetical protein DMD75_29000 [Candidatus Rokuibacteriota bacterium]|nr:MAG: hypothetical protein DMD75_29000 [Candidatus Rokubacteria bacterium]